ncbi:RagB/SusD family nutrient uptake outer membrane protein [Dyadobacter fermentans]|uniref:RagB/SusD domain protein n=1 Tax=Dyadobacter fermentans (strain ATCC 700827 / DSM 18053 / CIP 107007 / KCTC 52180 / NS114) TaxID=471854 RepID=C6VSP2_DYAFD|nr:RagB/SusD family nutrient uptake outer membrane protein [Dyadobacter fermentans]ACT92864.1 RagB/SusD domain protein [Dyadobacter fermentans DSM 18053]
MELMMKKLNITLILAALWLSSCSDLLNTEPEQNISDEAVIVDEKSANTALVGVYDALQGYATSNIIGVDLASDNVVNYNNQNNLVPDLTPNNAGGGFSAIYKMINQANFVIALVPGVQDGFFTQEERNQVLGEAYFLRALGYLDLVKTYGGVQLVLAPATGPDTHKGTKRSTAAETYAQIGADLDQAEQLLKETVNRTRATRFSVYALKARYFTYLQNWEQAEANASKVIAQAGFKLVKPYSAFFTGKTTEESIFELVYSTSDRNSFYTNWLSPADGGRHDYIPAREFVSQLLDPARGGARKSLLKQTAEGSWDLIQYGKPDGSSSVFILRIAEQYLIRAEARANKAAPDFTGALADLNAIRSRSDVPASPLTAASGKEAFNLAILEERRLELPFEGHRFVDVVRTGRSASIFGAVNANRKNQQFNVLPIPLTAIQTDGDLVQNPGY